MSTDTFNAVPAAGSPPPASPSDSHDRIAPLRGAPATLIANMTSSLAVPAATSVRTLPARLMVENRTVMNEHLRRTRGGKVSYTHLIAWALVQAIEDWPGQNTHYGEVEGRPAAITPAHVNLGIAVDLQKSDTSRTVVVPNIKNAETLRFTEFWHAYEAIVRQARGNALTPSDFEHTTLSVTNPGGLGTGHSVPRLMTGQSCVIGVGALEYPAAYQGASPEVLAELAIGQVLTLTSTYDHRVIQGAASGEYLRRVAELLTGDAGFYEEIFTELRIPYAPLHWAPDIAVDTSRSIDKTARVHELINAFRVRGHLIADTDPLEYAQRANPDLDFCAHGLSFWDLDRTFVTGGLGQQDSMTLRDIIAVLRDAYCRTVGIEYMYIADPAQREWIQDRVERRYAKPGHQQQLRILNKLNEAEAFETFLHTKYVGQTRFSLEGAESTIAALDTIMHSAARAGLDEVAIAMAHRGRLNVLTNIAGKTYGQIFREFEGGDDDTGGSGDVKYHLGTDGTYRGSDGERIAVSLAANPSHLDAVDAVLEGIVRAKQDRGGSQRYATLPVVIHGDAAMAGQGVIGETLQMSQLPGFHTGGTIRINLNNQLGFTTLPGDGRSSIYSTDIAKTVQAPVFHVNGDDPEAVVRVAELAFAYRQKFHRDVVIDLICYRRRGHNEGDDPSMTQPRMYDLISAKRTVRAQYLDALVGRGDITADEYDAAHRHYQERLENAFADARGDKLHPRPAGEMTATVDDVEAQLARERHGAFEPDCTGISASELHRIGDVFRDVPTYFTVHPKLDKLLSARHEMSRTGGIDWAFAELAAFGSLLLDGVPVRMSGQDSRRGTFVQRHAVLHDRSTGWQWSPLEHLSADQARFDIYDSLLSEYAVAGFEYGYSVASPDALVVWEAQFGDFINGAQIIVDEFIASAEQKWGQRSAVTLLLPHGYEGRGPDHSSGRIERFLQLCAQNNMTVAQPSTPASYFHLLRRHAYARPRHPLIVFTPKSMLRTRAAVSPVGDLLNGRFAPVIADPIDVESRAVRRVLLVSGKLYYELAKDLATRDTAEIAIVRLEQFYPLPTEQIIAALGAYPEAELVWVQEEPRNQGAWSFLSGELAPLLSRPLQVTARPPASAPATGSLARHAREQRLLIAAALGPSGR
jgi:multifunctional 2-oxoglutarate metabolism enzyme